VSSAESNNSPIYDTKHRREKAMNEEARTKVKQAIERELRPKLSTENALKDKL
jgi:hypothetical protein